MGEAPPKRTTHPDREMTHMVSHVDHESTEWAGDDRLLESSVSGECPDLSLVRLR